MGRVFKFNPKGNRSPADKIGFGLVEPGETYNVTDEQAAQLEQDADFTEVKSGKAKDAALDGPSPANPSPIPPEAVSPLPEGAITGEPGDPPPLAAKAAEATEQPAPAGEEEAKS